MIWNNLLLPSIFLTVPEMLGVLAERIGQKTAIRDEKTICTFQTLHQTAEQLASALLNQGIQPGQVIIVDLPVSVELVLAFCGIAYMGGIVLLVHGLHSPKEVQILTEIARPVAVIGQTAHSIDLPIYHVSELLTSTGSKIDFARPSETDLVLLRTTSGTTNRPKLVNVSHRLLLRRVATPGFHYRDDLVYGCALVHVFPSYQVFSALGAGGTVVFQHATNSFQIEKFIREEHINYFWGIPAFYEQIARTSEEPRQFPDLKAASSSGSSLSLATKHQVEKRWGVPVYQYYGQSELGFFTETDPQTPEGSVGKAVPGVEIRTINDNSLLSAGTVGNIQVKMEIPFGGYFSGEPSPTGEDGWFTTGDLGYLDVEGYLFLKGRANSLIHVGGCKVHPDEVSSVILTFPGVKEVYAFGEPHRIRGEKVAVAIVLEDGIAVREIKRFCRERLPGYKRPFHWYVVPELPRNGLGKVDQTKLLAIIRQQQP